MMGAFDHILQFALTRKRPSGSKEIQSLINEIAAINYSHSTVDEYNNLFVRIGSSKTIFMSHLDTVHKRAGKQAVSIKKGKWSTNEVLGADDGAGCALMSGMIERGIPGLYIFSQDEEIGGFGGKFIVENGDYSAYERVISFDRKGTRDICGAQACGNCASRGFVSELASQLGLGHKWATGSYTDGSEFRGIISEIVNISVGYENAHTNTEYLDYAYLARLFNACLTVDWESLPIVGPEPDLESNLDSWGHNWSKSIPIQSDTYEIASKLARRLQIPELAPEFDDILEAVEDAYASGKNARYYSVF